METCKYVLVGDENLDNLRLSQVLRKVYGKENVARFLALEYLEPFLISHKGTPVVICLDLFSFEVKEVTAVVGHIRDTYPKAVFNLYLDQDEYHRRMNELPEH